jgi:preprotein translocase subunit YajC
VADYEDFMSTTRQEQEQEQQKKKINNKIKLGKEIIIIIHFL